MVMITPKAGHEKSLVKAITEYHQWFAQFDGHHEYTWFKILTGPDTGKYIARSGNHNWSGMAEKDPSFFDIMSEALGGAEEFEAFMSDWGSTFKDGQPDG